MRQLVLIHGRDDARRMAPTPDDRSLVDITAAVLGDDSGRVGYSYSGLCLTSLPHRKLADDQAWEKIVGPVTLIIEPGRIKEDSGPPRFVGIPHGARARLILIYLQTQAVLTNSREISLGRSMRDWMGRMGMAAGGETAAALREQARRIATCNMRFHWRYPAAADHSAQGLVVTNANIIRSGLFFQERGDDDRQGALFEDRVVLDLEFYEQLRRHPVPLRDAAIRQLKDSARALDVYVWLAFRLHHLSKAMHINWRDLHEQFGAGYKAIRQFKPRFLQALAEAVAAYPEAKIDVEETHITLHPSPPPVSKLAAVGR